jgi:type IV pilus assembly protein PilA
MKKLKAFTLVEIMVVVALIAVLASIGLTNFIRVKSNANETIALSSLKTVITSAVSFRSVNSTYPQDLTSLSSATPAYIDPLLGSGRKNGYDFTIVGTVDSNNFLVTARPVVYGVSGARSFYVDQSGITRWCIGSVDCVLDENSSLLEN